MFVSRSEFADSPSGWFFIDVTVPFSPVCFSSTVPQVIAPHPHPAEDPQCQSHGFAYLLLTIPVNTCGECDMCVCLYMVKSKHGLGMGGSSTLPHTLPQVHAAIVPKRSRVMSSQTRDYLSLTWALWYDRALERLPVPGLAFLHSGSHRARFKGLSESSGEAAVSWTRLT